MAIAALWRRSQVRRFFHLRCADCGRRFGWSESPHAYSDGSRDSYHARCMSYRHWRAKATERLDVLDLVSEVWAIDAETVRELAAGRAAQVQDADASDAWGLEPSNAWNKAWRVFYDLDNARKAKGAKV